MKFLLILTFFSSTLAFESFPEVSVEHDRAANDSDGGEVGPQGQGSNLFLMDEMEQDRQSRRTVGCNSRFTIRSLNYPRTLPASYRTSFSFRLERNVRFRMQCSSFHLPRPESGLYYAVTRDSDGAFLKGYTLLNTGSRPETETIVFDGELNSVRNVYFWLFSGSNPNNLGNGYTCTVTGECATSTPPPPVSRRCGVCSGSRIVGGQFVNGDKYCFMGRLHTDPDHRRHICGGTLISPNTVLTAAHCVVPAAGVNVNNLRISFDCDTGSTCAQTIRASSIRVHPGYAGPGRVCSVGNDVAVVTLQSDVRLSGSVNFACLSERNCPSTSGTRMLVAGYGRTSRTDNSIGRRLKEAAVTTVPCSCRNNVRCTRPRGSAFGVPQGLTCNVDSGSFTGRNLGGRWVVEGVHSFGSIRCEDNANMGFGLVCSHVSSFIGRESPRSEII